MTARSSRAAALLAVAAAALGTCVEAGVLVITRPGGTPTIVNVPDTVRSRNASVPQGSSLGRSELWPTVQETARSHGVDPALVDLIIRMESGYNPSAVSPKGARGVMQLMPTTASLYGVRNPFDAKENIRGGVRYLKDLLERFGSNLGFALAAYNAGPDAVQKHGGVPPYAETQSYVSAILGAYQGAGGAPLLSGGFGRPRGARPVALLSAGGTSLISNEQRSGEASVDHRLGLR